MPREKKRAVELKAVDDEILREPEVVRLHAPGSEQSLSDEEPVKLGPAHPVEAPASRLELPKREEIEMRTHQPDIESLIDDAVTADLTESGWGEASTSRNPIPWGWFALIGMAIAAAVFWSLGHLRESTAQVETFHQEAQTTLDLDEQEEAEARDLIANIQATLRSYFNATSVNTLERLVRHPERVMPLIRQHHAVQPLHAAPLRSVRVLEPVTLDNRANFWMVSVVLANGELRNLILEIDEHGDPRIDWETLICHQPVPWDDFALDRKSGTSVDFRVYAEMDNFYSHEFADSRKWRSFRLTALFSDETLFGYMTPDHEDFERLSGLIRMNGGRKTSVILRLNIPQGLQSRRGVVIERLIAPRWLFVDCPTSET